MLRLGCCVLLLASLAAGQSSKGRQGQKSSKEETEAHYKKWLNEDVLYIISNDERKVFLALRTPDEKDAFIEQFWRRRNPDPRKGGNDFKEEHYRRIAYANEHFASGKDGWATDRGRIYIMFGPPTHIEDNSGGAYRRRPEEGGGYTSTYAFQRWFYDNIPGVGSAIEMEFVDATNTGQYRLALRPSEKDALWNIGTGLTWEEAMANPDRSNNVDRAAVMLSDLAMRNVGFGNDPVYMRGQQPFDRIRQYFNLSKPPEIKFKDLRAEVQATVTFNQIPMKVALGSYRVGLEAFLVPLTVQIPADELTFRTGAADVKQSVLNVYGRVENLARLVVYEFEDRVAATTYGRLVGSVTDQSGAVIPGIEVTATNKGTNVANKAITNDRGDYLIDHSSRGSTT